MRNIVLMFIINMGSSVLFGQFQDSLEIPKIEFKFKHFYLSVMDPNTDYTKYSLDSKNKGVFKVLPEAREIVYHGDSVLPYIVDNTHYSIVHIMKDAVTHSFIVESNQLPYQGVLIFWNDGKMIALMQPDDIFIIANDPKMMEKPE